MKVLKTDLAQWLVNENDDCGRDTYFSEDLRDAISTEESYKKFMRDFTKNELISIIANFSKDGQTYLDSNGID